MADLSTAVLIGRLTRDAELKYTNSGIASCKFTLATNSRVKKGQEWTDEASYWSIELWGKQGESINQYLTKGKQVAAQGSIRIEKWEHEGKTYHAVKMTADSVVLLGDKSGHSGAQNNSDESSYGRGRESASQGRHEQQGANRQAPQGRNPAVRPSDDDFVDDIPF